MPNYTLQLPQQDKQINAGKLGHIQAKNQYGKSFGFTDFYMQWDGKASLPVVGEFHFSRFSYLYWEEELLKMKAGGVQVVATYVFWNHHEEEEGIFRWDENRNLRHFIDVCAKVDISVIVRIGPFCHGEVRNGGIPDWVFDKPLEVRSNDSLYLDYATRLYKQISKQLAGQYFQDGGPIIGIQLDNEFMHCGAPQDSWGYKVGRFLSSGNGGTEHLNELKRIAKQVGINPEFFTATAWGGAAVPEEDTLPMLAGYAYTPWIPNQPPSREYLFQDLHVSPAEPVNYESTKYPVAYCEMAGGMQVSYTARPWVSASSVEAMTLVKMASGSNLLGYYMYHGGTNPVGKKTFLNEYGLPKLTYDYQSPLGEFGRVGESYDRIRLLALMLDEFGEQIAPMGPVIPSDQIGLDPTDTNTLRWMVRQAAGSGFLFLNNFQDHVELKDHNDLSIALQTAWGEVKFPAEGSLTLKAGVGAVLPFHLDVADIHIVSATVQPVTQLTGNGEKVVVFYAPEGISPELVIAAHNVTELKSSSGTVKKNLSDYVVKPTPGMEFAIEITTSTSQQVKIIVLTREEALKTYKLRLHNQDYIFISSARLHAKKDQLVVTSEGEAHWQLAVYPNAASFVSRQDAIKNEYSVGIFKCYTLEVDEYKVEAKLEKLKEQHFNIQVSHEWPSYVADVFLNIAYEGDVAALYANQQLITDHIHYGDVWSVGLKQFKRAANRIAITCIDYAGKKRDC